MGGVAINYRFTRLLFFAKGVRIHLDNDIGNLGRLGRSGDVSPTQTMAHDNQVVYKLMYLMFTHCF